MQSNRKDRNTLCKFPKIFTKLFFLIQWNSSEYGSFTEGDIHIGRNGVSIAQSPKSPNVEEFFQKDELEIYEDRVLGHGAFGVVKLAHYKQTDSIVAVKVTKKILKNNYNFIN